MSSPHSDTAAPRVLLVMGVAGSGKTTIGAALAKEVHWDFADADDFHPASNVAKMSAGIPLNDEDRAPWLTKLRGYIEDSLKKGRSLVLTCSALKQKYRDRLTVDPAHTNLVYLKGPRSVLLERIGHRHGHFMKPEMLDSQLATLEEPKDALVVDIARTPEQIVAEIREKLRL